MKLRSIIVFSLLLALPVPAICQDIPATGDTRDPASNRPPRIVGCENVEDRTVHIKADDVSSTAGIVRGEGNVEFQQGKKYVTASEAEYNLNTDTGKLSNVTFTTCSNEITPDYSLKAREITLLPNERIRARNVSLFLGKFRVLALPYFNMRVGSRTATRNVFPRPGYDKTDGYTLSQDFRFIDQDALHANADLRLTTRNGVQGQIYSLAGIDGDLIDLPGRYLSYDSLRSDALEMPPQSDTDCAEVAGPDPNAARFRGFGRFTLKQRTYDIQNSGLVVYRQPELGVTYLGNQINLTKQRLDPRLEIYPEVTTSWGRFRESPGLGSYTGRTTASAAAAFNILPLGPKTAVQPFVSYAWSAYGTGDNYRVSTIGLDTAHLWRNGSIVAIRYINRNESGFTPFQFDNVDVHEELQGALQVQTKKYVGGVAVGYNMDTRRIYDWEVMLGWRSDCLQSSVRYNQRLQRLSFDVGLINL